MKGKVCLGFAQFSQRDTLPPAATKIRNKRDNTRKHPFYFVSFFAFFLSSIIFLQGKVFNSTLLISEANYSLWCFSNCFNLPVCLILDKRTLLFYLSFQFLVTVLVKGMNSCYIGSLLGINIKMCSNQNISKYHYFLQ